MWEGTKMFTIKFLWEHLRIFKNLIFVGIFKGNVISVEKYLRFIKM